MRYKVPYERFSALFHPNDMFEGDNYFVFRLFITLSIILFICLVPLLLIKRPNRNKNTSRYTSKKISKTDL